MLAMAVITVNTHSLWNNKAVCKSQQSGHLISGAEWGERKVNNANSIKAASTQVQKTKQQNFPV